MLFDPWELISLLKFFLTHQQLTRIGKRMFCIFKEMSQECHMSLTELELLSHGSHLIGSMEEIKTRFSFPLNSLLFIHKIKTTNTVTHSKLSKMASCVFVCFWVFKSAFVNSNVIKWARKCQGPHHDLHLAIFTYLLISYCDKNISKVDIQNLVH